MPQPIFRREDRVTTMAHQMPAFSLVNPELISENTPQSLLEIFRLEAFQILSEHPVGPPLVVGRENLRAVCVNKAFKKVAKGDVGFHYVIDMASLKRDDNALNDSQRERQIDAHRGFSDAAFAASDRDDVPDSGKFLGAGRRLR